MFNAFNHTSSGGAGATSINANMDSSSFGRFNATGGARELGFNARLTF
jgi:hypothetical protein